MRATAKSPAYSDDGFWNKVKRHARTAGAAVLEPALKLYFAARDADTPLWARTAMAGALAYFISPIDAIPDLTPVLGYSDDLGVLLAALATTAAYIKQEHADKARDTMRQWLG